MQNKFRLAMAAGILLASGSVCAQGYPAKPIRIVSPYPPGGSTDIVVRLVAPRLSAAMGQPVIVENRAGASGMIGCDVVAKATPDGYTILFTTPGTHTAIGFTVKNVPYDPVKDFTPITAAVTQSGVVLVNNSTGVKNFREFIEYAKKNRGKVSFGTAGMGTSFHVTGETLNRAAGIDMLHIPYKGGAPVAQAITSGEIPVALVSNTSGVTTIKSGRVTAVAVLGDKRLREIPDVPVIGDFVANVERPGDWLGFYGPAGLPPAILDRLYREIMHAVRLPEVGLGLAAAGMEIYGNTPEEFRTQILREIELYRKLVPILGIKPE
ncbi:MAG: Bug family tripartite tricarboxylate transporter substrate binding protein [Burkholderiales bacterium]